VFITSCGKNEITDVNLPSEPDKTDPATIVIIGSSTAAGVNRLRLSTLDNKKTLYYVNLAVAGY
jgi:hypothetical protein